MLSSAGDGLISHVPILCKIFERSALGLGDQKGGEDTREHKCREDLHDVVEPWAGVLGGRLSANAKGRNSTLSDDGTNLSGGSRDSVRG
jgi:hypothetical protein